MAPSHHSKVSTTQNQRIPFFNSAMSMNVQLIAIDIAPLTVLFFNYPLADLKLPTLKDISFNVKFCWFAVINQ